MARPQKRFGTSWGRVWLSEQQGSGHVEAGTGWDVPLALPMPGVEGPLNDSLILGFAPFLV